MKSSLGITVIITMAFTVVVTFASCAKHAHVAEPAAPPATDTKAAEIKSAESVTPTTASAETDPRQMVVARVNGVELHMDALVTIMNRLASQASGTTPEAIQDHKKRSLDKLILQELAYQQAKAQGMSIESNKIDMAIKNFKENVGGEKEYAEYLAKMKVTEADLRTEVERGLLLETIYYREVLGKVRVPEDEVKKEYEKEKHRYILPESASIIDVVIFKRNGKDSANKAKELLKKIKAEDNDPWKLVLDGTFIVRDIKVNKGFEKELLEVTRKMKPNELSGVLETSSGSHIIKLDKYSPERQATFDEVKDRIEVKFKVPAQEKRTQEWEQELRSGAKIEIMDRGAESRESKGSN